MIGTFIKNVHGFYRQDCCWPYAVSFVFVLVIYWLDFFFADSSYHCASSSAYGIILAYYLYNLRLYLRNGLNTKNDGFFIRYLSFKVAVWGLILAVLFLLR